MEITDVSRVLKHTGTVDERKLSEITEVVVQCCYYKGTPLEIRNHFSKLPSIPYHYCISLSGEVFGTLDLKSVGLHSKTPNKGIGVCLLYKPCNPTKSLLDQPGCDYYSKSMDSALKSLHAYLELHLGKKLKLRVCSDAQALDIRSGVPV